MEEISPIKEILYSEIKKISEKKIHQFLQNNEYSSVIKNLLENIMPKISNIDGENEEKLGVLAESISHFMLTEMLIPTQRKIIHNDIEIDIIIPNLNKLKDVSDDAIIINFDKSTNSNEIHKQIEALKTIQKNEKNIWIVSNKKLHSVPNIYRTDQHENSFSNLFTDVRDFVTNKKFGKLNISNPNFDKLVFFLNSTKYLSNEKSSIRLISANTGLEVNCSICFFKLSNE